MEDKVAEVKAEVKAAAGDKVAEVDDAEAGEA